MGTPSKVIDYQCDCGWYQDPKLGIFLYPQQMGILLNIPTFSRLSFTRWIPDTKAFTTDPSATLRLIRIRISNQMTYAGGLFQNDKTKGYSPLARPYIKANSIPIRFAENRFISAPEFLSSCILFAGPHPAGHIMNYSASALHPVPLSHLSLK